jgi:hypothetical protein
MRTKIEKFHNCIVLKIQIFSLVFNFIKLNEKLDKNFIFQFNRFENGNIDIFVSIFKKYNLEIISV